MPRSYGIYVDAFMVSLLAVAFFVCACPVPDIDDGAFFRSISIISGISSPEDLDEYELERFRSLEEHPIDLNNSSRTRLLSCGLFTAYQVASVLDYISRYGDILSFPELAAVDGIGQERAEALKVFVTLKTNAPPGRTAGHRVAGEAVAKSALRMRNGSPGVAGERDLRWNYAARFGMEIGRGLEFSVSACQDYDGPRLPPDAYSFFVAYYGRRSLGKLVLGDFNLRFGQGLALWSGMSMDKMTTPAAFTRNPTGIVPSSSFSGTYCQRGVGAEFSMGHFQLSTAMAFPGLQKVMSGSGKVTSPPGVMPVLSLTHIGRIHRVSVTSFVSMIPGSPGMSPAQGSLSSDFIVCVRGTDIFGEAVWDYVGMRGLGMAGVRTRFGEHLTGAMQLRYLGRDCHEALTAIQWKSLTFSADAKFVPKDCHFQFSTVSALSRQFGTALKLDCRLTYRLRNWDEHHQADLRCDLKWESGPWMALSRVNVHYCTAFSGLAYLEGGWKPRPKTALYVRVGAFHIDDWANRIYVYERDAPGNFNVPALYGRGIWGTCYGCVQCGRMTRIFLRVSGTTKNNPRLVSGDIRMQCAVTF